MEPHPRIRKIIKWAGATVTVLLVIAMLVSRWKLFGYHRGTTMVQFRAGCLDIALEPRPIPAKFAGWHTLAAKPPQLQWWYHIDDDPIFKTWRGVFPLWWAIVPMAAITALAWRADAIARRRARLNLCAKCGYDCSGIPHAAACPECGARP